MNNSEWADKEANQILMESVAADKRGKNKRKTIDESMDYLKITLLLLILFLGFSKIDAQSPKLDYILFPEIIIYDNECTQMDGGVWFMCKQCRRCQWQDANQRDWMGRYYCVNCGAEYR
jgi:hypothetical protein